MPAKLSTTEAVELARFYGVVVSGPTMRKWITQFKLGKQIGGTGLRSRWRIDRQKLIKLLEE